MATIGHLSGAFMVVEMPGIVKILAIVLGLKVIGLGRELGGHEFLKKLKFFRCQCDLVDFLTEVLISIPRAPHRASQVKATNVDTGRVASSATFTQGETVERAEAAASEFHESIDAGVLDGQQRPVSPREKIARVLR